MSRHFSMPVRPVRGPARGTGRRRPRGSSVLVVVALVVAVMAATAGAASAKPAPTPPPKTFGVALPGAPWDLTELDGVTAATGRQPDSVTWYAAWSSGGDFPASAVAQLAARGIRPELTWEPWDPAAGTNQPQYALKRITAGDHDAYLKRWASQIRSYGKPLTIRLAHEMNGSWYPWAEQVNGNAPGDYAAAWRHVVDVFKAAKVSNVTWRWSPNVPYTGSTPLKGLYPGDAYVTEVALDGYNWSTLQAGSQWTSFGEVFSPGLAELASITSRPAFVGEVGCPEDGGDKAAWVDDMFAWLSTHPQVRGLTWFDFQKEADWRLDSSDASLAAFQRGLPSFH